MNHLTREYVTKLKDSLLFINAVVIIYNASLFLLSTKYISVHYYARDFLNKVSYITRTPQNIFFESIFLFIIIVLLMKLREKDNLKMANGLVYIEIILSFLLIIPYCVFDALDVLDTKYNPLSLLINFILV